MYVATHYDVAGDCGFGYETNMKLTTRHEIGHSTGLSHLALTQFSPCVGTPAGDDAMTSDWSPDINAWLDYNTHHVTAHMNCLCG